MNYPQSLADKVLFESELANPHVTGRPSSSDESNTSSNAHSTNNRENIDAHDESEAANSGGYANPLSNLLSFLGEFTGVMFSILLSFIISSVVAGIPAAAIGLLIEPLVKPIFGPDSVAVIALMGIFIFTGWMMIPKNESEFDEFGAWMNILTWLLVIISVCIGIIFIPVIMFLRA
jgi:VIT1/CCC1 family predicted Fe2+/Mn2+ transporter